MDASERRRCADREQVGQIRPLAEERYARLRKVEGVGYRTRGPTDKSVDAVKSWSARSAPREARSRGAVDRCAR
jgi:hypothetical protein